MRLYHCPRDGSLLVRDCNRWMCLLCGYAIEPPKEAPPIDEWPWPPAANPKHEVHTRPVPVVEEDG